MYVIKKIACLIVVLVAILVACIYTSVGADQVNAWLSTTPQVQKLVDLGDGKRPALSNLDCSPGVYSSNVPTYSEVSICTNNTPFGSLGGGYLYDGSDRLRLKGPGPGDEFISTNSQIMLLRRPSVYNGFTMGVYTRPSIAQLEKVNDYVEPYYRYSAEPDWTLTDPTTGEALRFNPDALSFSANGQWMVLDSPGRGLARINLTTKEVMLFANSIESYDFYGLSSAQFAISDDGTTVASSLINGNGGSQDALLTMFDLNDCNPAPESYRAGLRLCKYQDIWQSYGTRSGIGKDIGTAGKPVRLRFLDANSLSFDTIYDQTAISVFKSARYIASVNNLPTHKLGLLGMGDSYISGEGEFDYRLGTDNKINTCHQSKTSYPYLLGSRFSSSNSIACSGAKMNDITNNSEKYEGQVKDHVKQVDRINKAQILSQFLPGYLNQLQFVQTYTPEAVVVSIGGNDIGFSDILKSCVANTHGGTCYDSYEDRLELMNHVDAQFYNLRSTYLAIKNASPGVRIYVIGYPQVIKPNGNCGVNVHLNAVETEFSRQFIAYMDQTVRQAARSAGVVYVDTQHAFDGYRLCEATGSLAAVNGLTAGTDGGPTVFGKEIKVIGSESYHPTQFGHVLLANAISTATHDLSLPMPAQDLDVRPVPIDSADPLLADRVSTGRPTQPIVYDHTLSRDVLATGQMQSITYDSAATQLAPASTYVVELHSDLIRLATGMVSADGSLQLTVRIPSSVPAGFHTLHIYGHDLSGDMVDIQKRVFVVSDSDQLSVCGVVPASGQDDDSDNIDDACDPIISDRAIPITGQATLSEQTTSLVEPNIILSADVVNQANFSLTASSRAALQGGNTTGQVLGAVTIMSDASDTQIVAIRHTSIKAASLVRVGWRHVIIGSALLIGLALLSIAAQNLVKTLA